MFTRNDIQLCREMSGCLGSVLRISCQSVQTVTTASRSNNLPGEKSWLFYKSASRKKKEKSSKTGRIKKSKDRYVPDPVSSDCKLYLDA